MSNWLADDPELLRAALEIIETWDEDASADSISVRSPLTDGGSDSAPDENDGAVVELDDSGEDSFAETKQPETNGSLMVRMRLPPLDVKPVETKKSVSRGLKPSTVASTRHRRREEIIYLRDKVKEMEANLVALQTTKKGSTQPSFQSKEGTDKAMAVVWHDIASRQQRLRQKSELDQLKLRELLETQMKVAQGLMKLMQKARRIEEDDAYPHLKRMKLLHEHSSSLRMDEGEQLARIHRHYETLDAAFAFPKFHDGSLKFVDVEIMDELEEEVTIEYREAWAVPFEKDRVLDALWEYTLKRNQKKWCAIGGGTNTSFRTGDLEHASRFSVTSTLCGFTGTFNGQVVVKRFGSDDGKAPAILSNMCSDPHPENPGDLDGFYIHDDVWMRVVPAAPCVHEAGGMHVATVQCRQRVHVRFRDDTVNLRHAAGELTNMILDRLKDDIELKHDTVETLLLRSRSCGR